jgi:AraC-like DNA-binding protein
MENGNGIDTPRAMDPRIAHVIDSMERDFDGRLTIAGLAAAVNLSPSRLAVLFKRETGVSPVRYLRALRMERARLLLERTFLSVKEVMTFVGVHDPSHFTRDFSRHHGIPPTRLRQYSWAPEAWRVKARPQFARDRPSRGRGAVVEANSSDGEPASDPSHTDGQPIIRSGDIPEDGDR